MKFIDYANIYVKSGDGGHGHISFRKEKFVAKGGPDGGNGGRGGDVVFVVDSHLNTLLDFKYNRQYLAENGQPGGKKNCTGKNGKNLVIRVPQGTIVKNSDTDEIIADLSEAEQQVVLAEGGKGGKGNAEFTTATRQAPRFAQDGIPGIEINITLELKLLADVGIVGFPNVGKSTLISVISEAKPKIADYHFTTLVPNLGIVRIGEYENFTVADIPGLIEGASEGKGLGIQFLRHVERTRLLLFLLDAQSENPKKDYKILNEELNKYNPEMKDKAKIICISKVDTVDEAKKKKLQNLKFEGTLKPLMLSSVINEGVDKVKWAMWDVVKNKD